MNKDVPQELPARRGFTVSYLGKTLLSKIDPVAQGERAAAEIEVKEKTLYLCPSPLYGYGLPIFLEKLKNHPHSKNSAVLCIEADEQLFKISQTSFAENKILDDDFSGKNFCSVALIKAGNPAQVYAFIQKTWGARMFRRLEVLRLGGGWQLFQKQYNDIEAAIRQELALEWGNAMTLIRLGRLYIRNLIRNLSFLPLGENISALNFGSSPVLVLGAGPSLDALLKSWLDELPKETSPNQRRFKIICVDTCLPALHERGIIPDLVIILESQHWNMNDFTGARGRKINAAIDLSALPASARVLDGKRYFFATPWTSLKLFKRLEDAGILPQIHAPLGSVGLSAAALALCISSGPVFTCGMDFSFTIDAYHARATQGHTSQLLRQNRFRSIINAAAVFRDGTFSAASKTGKAVRSDPAMRKYRDLFEQSFGREKRLLDAAGSGLPLGIKTIPQTEVLAVLNGGQTEIEAAAQTAGSPVFFDKEKIKTFILNEIKTLKLLRDMLTGETSLDPARLEELLDAADYLWAHFPDCAGAGGRRPGGTDSGFLKRVRTEIDPFLKYWEMPLRELDLSETSLTV